MKMGGYAKFLRQHARFCAEYLRKSSTGQMSTGGLISFWAALILDWSRTCWSSIV